MGATLSQFRFRASTIIRERTLVALLSALAIKVLFTLVDSARVIPVNGSVFGYKFFSTSRRKTFELIRGDRYT